MSHLILPGHLAEEFAMADEGPQAPDLGQAMSFRFLLKQLDRYLDIAWVPLEAKSFPTPGRWYIVRRHPHGNDELNTYWVVANEDGSYCAPDERHLDNLKRIDSLTHDRFQRMRDQRSARQKQKAKEYEATRQAFRELLAERIDHLNDARISTMATSRGTAEKLWTPEARA